MAWELAAQGTSFSQLNQLIANRTLKKGDRVRVVMDCPGFDFIFNAAGAEQAFYPFKPSGMDIVDVWGSGGQGFVEMEADPAELLAVLGAIAYWSVIVIAIGIAIYVIVSLIRIFVWGGAGGASIPVALILGIGVGAVGLALITRKKSPAKST